MTAKEMQTLGYAFLATSGRVMLNRHLVDP